MHVIFLMREFSDRNGQNCFFTNQGAFVAILRILFWNVWSSRKLVEATLYQTGHPYIKRPYDGFVQKESVDGLFAICRASHIRRSPPPAARRSCGHINGSERSPSPSIARLID